MRIILIISILFISAVCWSQSFTAKCSHENVGVGERLKVTYTLEGADGKKFIQPTFDGFRLLSGPNTSSSMQWVNGVHSSSKSWSFILLAEQLGKKTIPAASVKTRNEVITSNSIDVNVTKAKQKTKQTKTKKSNATSGNVDLSSNLFMKLYVDQKSAYVGEQIIATYKLYLNTQVVNYSHNRPVYNGFYAQEIEIDPNSEIKTETINGKQFRVATMKKVVLTPQKSGEIEIPPLEMEMIVRLENKQSRRSFWDPFGSFKDVKYEVKSNPQTISVSALPLQDQPGDYTGAVGAFTLDVKTDLDKVNVNEAVNLVVKIEGKGNIELISEPELDFPQDFEHYEPKTKQNISVTSGGTKGYKSFEYVLIPRYSGEFELEPITLSFFDPSSGTYKRLKTDPINLSVNKASGDQGDEMAYIAPKKEDVQIIGKDIRYIKSSSTSFSAKPESFLGTIGFYSMGALPFASMGLVVFMVKTFRRRELDVVSTKSRQARAMAKKHLKSANKSLGASDSVFYEEIYKALNGYLSDKFNIPISDLTKEEIKEVLNSRGADSDLISELMQTLDDCEIARFAPIQAVNHAEMLAKTETIIHKIEDAV